MSKDLSLKTLPKEEKQIFKTTSTDFCFGLNEEKVSEVLKELSEKMLIKGYVLV